MNDNWVLIITVIMKINMGLLRFEILKLWISERHSQNSWMVWRISTPSDAMR